MAMVNLVWYKTEDGQWALWGVYSNLDAACTAFDRILKEGYGVEARINSEHVNDGTNPDWW